jgi:hypothetical protein
MSDLKSVNKRVDQISLISSLFLCSESSARHFDAFHVCKLGATRQSARHLAGTAARLSYQTIYIGGKNISLSYCASQDQQVTKHA